MAASRWSSPRPAALPPPLPAHSPSLRLHLLRHQTPSAAPHAAARAREPRAAPAAAPPQSPDPAPPMAAPQPAAPAPEAPPSAQVVGNAFVQQYYLVLHQSPDLVYRFYQDASRLARPASAAGMDSVTTMEAISEKIMEMDVSKAEIRTVDSQESLGGGVTVLVTGHLTGRDGVRREFSQSFFLAPQEKGYFVLNDIFRFVGDIPAPTAVDAQPDADAVAPPVAAPLANGTATPAVEPAIPDDHDAVPQREVGPAWYWLKPQQQQSITPSMGVSFSNLTDAACVVHQFKIKGYSATKSMARTDSLPSKRLAVGGYEWEVHYTPSLVVDGGYWIAFRLVLLSAPRRNDLKAAFRCRLLYTSSNSNNRQQRGAHACVRDVAGNVEGQISHAFKQAKESSGWIPLRKRNDVEASGVIENDSFTAECTITVVTELPPEPDTAKTNVVRPPIPPLSGLHSLHHDLGELLSKATGSDVVLVLSGESFAAHKAILASRSPVFMAQFFGLMKETHSQRVEIMDMEAAVFGAMLRFMYTDMVPELERQEDGAIIAQHLLAAADRYGLERLKSMCEDKLCDGTRVETAATTLALAEQHGCPKLKARCVEFIAANLDEVMATEGYKHLMTSSPLVLNDLLRAVRGRKN